MSYNHILLRRIVDEMSKKKQNLIAELEEKVDPEFRAYLLTEIPKGEALLDQIKPKHPRYGDVIRPLTKMYWVMNQQLGITCKHLGYPLQQWKWDQSEPLTELAKVFQGISHEVVPTASEPDGKS